MLIGLPAIWPSPSLPTLLSFVLHVGHSLSLYGRSAPPKHLFSSTSFRSARRNLQQLQNRTFVLEAIASSQAPSPCAPACVHRHHTPLPSTAAATLTGEPAQTGIETSTS